MRPPRHRAIAAALSPLAALYGLAVARRNARFDRGEGVIRASLPVISVGNLAAGGTGKTPMTAWLVARLRAAGRTPAVITRGYGGRAGAGPLDVSHGTGPLVGADVAGDEPVVLAATTGAIVVAGSDRVRGVARAAELGADVAVLDDGFQHRRLARDLDVVLLDAADPFGNGRLLPAGPLREPPGALARAGIVVLTRWESTTGPAGREAVRGAGVGAPILRAVHRRAGFRDRGGRPVAAPRRAVAFCGIARPDTFLRDLGDEGVDVAAFLAFPDHHRYSEREIARIAGQAAGAAVVTTAKDIVRLARGGPLANALALEIALDVLDPEPLDAALARAVGGRP